MYNIISKYISNLSINDIYKFANFKNISLSSEEALFILDYIKNNYLDILKYQDISILDKYKDKFKYNNYLAIKDTLIEYKNKYGNLFKSM